MDEDIYSCGKMKITISCSFH